MLNRNSPQLAPTNIKTQAISWARQAGQIALSYFNNVSVDCKADNSVLTRADVEIEQFLVSQIRSTYQYVETDEAQWVGIEVGYNPPGLF